LLGEQPHSRCSQAAGALAIAHWRADLVESRRRARVVFVGAIGCVFAALAASDFIFGSRALDSNG
jgi:hypothetical protein